MSTPPFIGPIEDDPTPQLGRLAAAPNLVGQVSGAMLRTAIDGIPTGAYDRAVIRALAYKEPALVATIASLIWRARTTPVASATSSPSPDESNIHAALARIDSAVAAIRTELRQ